MKFTKTALIAAGVCATIAPAGAFALPVDVGSAQFPIGFVGYGPVICRTKVEASMVAPVAGTVSLGLLREFYNSPSGYRVIADRTLALELPKNGQVGKINFRIEPPSNRVARIGRALPVDDSVARWQLRVIAVAAGDGVVVEFTFCSRKRSW